jgi:eukaryotic-like serine/threonine-protein kinase
VSDYDRSPYHTADFAALDDPQLPERFQNYILDKNVIGEGPISFSYRATRLDGNRSVRLKVLRKRICLLAGAGETYQRAKTAQMQYTGDHLLQMTGATVHDNILILEYEYFESVSLRSLIENDTPFHPDLAALIAMEIITGLSQIHGVRPSPGLGNLVPLHRNLKPENVLISPNGEVRLTDIGMLDVAAFCDAARLELPYDTRVYQSPEQLLREGYADRRSDVFSLGLLILEMMTSRLPYSGGNVFEVRQNIRENRRVSMESLYPVVRDRDRKKLTRQLAQLCEKMTLHDSEKRIQSLVDVESQLFRYLEGSKYADRARALADFLQRRSFHVERISKRGFIDRLFGG